VELKQSIKHLEEENAKLKEQLEKAQEAAQKWQSLHAQLHSYCVDQMLPTKDP